VAEAILNRGATRVTTDGVTVEYDLVAVRARLTDLKAQQDATKRPRAAGIDLSG
jgi:hypothetical protein